MPTENYSPNWHVRCVSVPGPDTDLTLHVSFDNARYIFGCGEGTQRAYVQKKLGLKGVEAVFLSDAQNRTRMGLPGVIMTAADTGIPQLNVVGPPDTAHFISTFRSSVMRADFKVVPKSMSIGKSPHDITEMFQSSNVTVKAVSLVPMALRTTPINSDSSPIDIDTFRPDFSSTRPTVMPRPELEAWRDLIVSHMFTRAASIDARRDQPKGPFVRNDGTFAASWPEIRYPLPLPTPEEQATELVYILEPPPVRGKFDVKRAIALGVPNGPIRGKLVKGEDIEVDDPTAEGGKRIVRPVDCLVGGGPGAVLIVVTCSPANLPSLLESTAFRRYQTSSAGDEEARKVHMIVHRVSSSVYRAPAYQAWMASFGDETQHFIADFESYTNDPYFRSAARHMEDLSKVDNRIFRKQYGSLNTTFETASLPSNASVLLPNHQVRMHPPAKAELVPNHDKDEPLSKASSNERPATFSPEYKAAREGAVLSIYKKSQAMAALLKDPAGASVPGHDITVTTLGTGSAIPSKYRNVSSTILHVPRLCSGVDGAILLDCGEGTLGQMRRRFGPDGMMVLYGQLKMIFISHMHADHHLGLHSILEDRFKHGVTAPLYILAPTSIGLHLQESSSWQQHASDEALANVVFITSTRLANNRSAVPGSGGRSLYTHKSPASSPGPGWSDSRVAFHESMEGAPYTWGQEDLFTGARRWPHADCMGISEAINRNHFHSVDQMLIDLDIKWAQVPWVSHRGSANGLVIRHNTGWKIVYSGDTKPCETLVKIGKGATLLIHEATLEDDKAEMAAYKGHSTFSQAIQVGKDMKAQHILLNHFSQRYPKIPKLPALMPSSPSAPTTATATSPRSSRSGSPAPNAEPIVSISFDLMSIQVSDMWKMAHYMDSISLLFPEEEDADAIEVDEAPETEKKASQKEPVPVEKKGTKKESASLEKKDVKTESAKEKRQRSKAFGLLPDQQEGHGRAIKKRRSPSPTKLSKKQRSEHDALAASGAEATSVAERARVVVDGILADMARTAQSQSGEAGPEKTGEEARNGEGAEVVNRILADRASTVQVQSGGEGGSTQTGEEAAMSQEGKLPSKLRLEPAITSGGTDIDMGEGGENVEKSDIDFAPATGTIETGLTPSMEDIAVSVEAGEAGRDSGKASETKE